MATTRSVLNSVSRENIFGVGPGNDSHMKEAGILAFTLNTVDFSLLFQLDLAHEEYGNHFSWHMDVMIQS